MEDGLEYLDGEDVSKAEIESEGNISRDVIERELMELLLIERELLKKKKLSNPLNYGLPDLLFPRNYGNARIGDNAEIVREKLFRREPEFKYKQRQKEALKSFVENDLYATKDGKRIEISLIPQQLDFLTDIFFRHVNKAIVWKPRGGGGSLVVAILIWLMLVYHQKSVVDLAGSLDQAKNVYNYVKGFWNCFPELKEHMLSGDPLLSKTELNTGVILECLSSSDQQARGRHEPVLIIDEAAQKDSNKDEVFIDAMNGTMNKADHVIVLLSTFHVPVGFFQENWDNAEKKGFKRYKWNVYDIMQPCEAGLEYATEEDPLAKNFCRDQCPLTREKKEYDDMGRLVGVKYTGCDGYARDSIGFQTREQVISTQMLNSGTEKFHIEFECNRPEFSGPVFGVGNIEDSIIDKLPYEKTGQGIVGVDWGYASEGAIVLLKDFEDYIGLVDGHCLSRKSLREWVDVLDKWQREASKEDLIVYADNSHHFNNLELEQLGYDVNPVQFSEKVRHWLESNVLRYFSHRKIKISSHVDKVIEQLKGYRKNPRTGKVIKKDDHGPDAIEAAFAHDAWDFNYKYAYYLKQRLKQQFIDEENYDKEEDMNNVDILTF